jgi:hypothetical protein
MPSNNLPPIAVKGKTITLPKGARVRYLSPTAVYRMQENGWPGAGEGGRISLVADNIEDDRLTDDQKIVGSTVMLNFRKDDPMKEYPLPVEAGGKRWTVILVEHTAATTKQK